MKKKQTIEDFLENYQIFEALPTAWLDNERADNTEKAIGALYDAVKLLHQISLPKDDEFWEHVDCDSLYKINLFLTEQLYLLSHKDNG